MTRQGERRATTRAGLLAAARGLFADRGYHAVSAEEIVAAAGLSRGALYHHFAGKEGLFAALYDDVQAEVAGRIEAAAERAPDAGAALRAGCHAFLAAGLDPLVQRVVLLDAPAVLGWERWREADDRHGLASLVSGLETAMAAGAIAPQPPEPLARLLGGAMNEAAMWTARSPDPAVATAEATTALDALLDGLRPVTTGGRRSIS